MKYVNPELGPEYQARILSELDPDFLHYFPQRLLAIAKLCRRGEYSVSPSRIFTYGENLTSGMREYIGETFDAPVVDLYSTTEFGTVAWSCPEGGYHINEDVVYPEIKEVEEGTGSLVLSGLVNSITPFLRYDIGDLVEVQAEKCSCDTSFMKVGGFRGRRSDVFRNSSGER
ncbi:MAG: hypothetical protein ABEJ66_02625, partial [Candidatus Nanohaloarchaea archaeon]